jgi:chaperonin GroES|uniref:Co-chaperonin GroES n=1 Tax=candidate division CPR3 bacterium TaxID=2268181 RepID=A0A7C5Z3J1_UNCC3
MIPEESKKLAKRIQPIGGKILVEPAPKQKKTKTGIIIPDTASEERPQEGVIVALGTGKRNEKGELIPFTVKVGDRILFKRYSPDEFEIDSHKFLILEEDDILAVIK